MYKMIKRWYKSGLWNAERVQQAVGRFITQEQADAIINGEN